ncbi:zinc finger protein 462-like [Falco rusticolus]|uniref:zinc finger protein 462-like n=1 Tax=Falco rusticolus TaxID=120794 RepID=UPI00188689E0|nr:zinc finger protein 462-like [Falco rusticolus]
MTIGQLKDHSLRVHGKALTLPRPRVVSLSPSLGYHTSKKHISAEAVEDTNDSSYSEPPDVQQQLNHYQSAALARNNISRIPLSGSAAGVEKTEAILNCEFCDFPRVTYRAFDVTTVTSMEGRNSSSAKIVPFIQALSKCCAKQTN